MFHQMASLRHHLQLAGVLLLALLLASCRGGVGAGIFSREQPPPIQIDYHVVSSGETMYSIAWRYEMDYQTLAHINGIGPPYTIFPGQKLVLESPAQAGISSPAPAQNRGTVVATPGSVPSVRAGTPSGTAVTTAPVPAPRPAQVTPVTSGSTPWQWPVPGVLVSAFGANGGLQKGVLLSTSNGESVRAAATGQVVYSGSGLRAYGNLVIIKHNEQFLSAYAYNSRLLVDEGQRVEQGDVIAESGKDPDGRERLYFEIRRDGKPVDPITYLPRR